MDWPMFRHVERQATRLADMMQRVEVDTTKLVRQRMGDAYAEARTKCIVAATHASASCGSTRNPPSLRGPDVSVQISRCSRVVSKRPGAFPSPPLDALERRAHKRFLAQQVPLVRSRAVALRSHRGARAPPSSPCPWRVHRDGADRRHWLSSASLRDVPRLFARFRSRGATGFRTDAWQGDRRRHSRPEPHPCHFPRPRPWLVPIGPTHGPIIWGLRRPKGPPSRPIAPGRGLRDRAPKGLGPDG